MVRARSARCTEIKDPPKKMYLVGYLVDNTILTSQIECSSVEVEQDIITVWEQTDGLSEQIAGFRNWVFYREVKKDDINPPFEGP